MSDDDGNIMTNRERFREVNVREGERTRRMLDSPEQRIEALRLAAQSATSTDELIASAKAIHNFIVYGPDGPPVRPEPDPAVTGGDTPGEPGTAPPTRVAP